jgi:hypothetical protein
LQEKTRAALKPGVGRIEPLLDAVSLGGAVPDSVRRVVLELSQVRNLVVHKNGVVDRRFVDQCPWVRADVGGLLVIHADDLHRYGLAVDWYNLEMGNRARRLLSEPEHTGSIELQRDLEKLIVEYLDSRPEGTVGQT